jgi:hypothetical protein
MALLVILTHHTGESAVCLRRTADDMPCSRAEATAEAYLISAYISVNRQDNPSHLNRLISYLSQYHYQAIDMSSISLASTTLSSIREAPTQQDNNTPTINSPPPAPPSNASESPSLLSEKEERENVAAEDMPYLPYRTMTETASMSEYVQETATGLRSVKSHRSGKLERFELVTFKENDVDNPKNWSKAYKWWCTMIVATTCFVVAFNSAVITADIEGVCEEFGVSQEVGLLSVTLFVSKSTASRGW